MIRLVGVAMLLTASAALGLSAAGELSARVRELEELILSFKTMEWELAGRATPLPTLLERILPCVTGSVKDFYLLCLSGMERGEHAPFFTRWTEAAAGAQLHLDDHERLLLADVGSVLGRYDRESQCAALRDARERLTRSLEGAKERRERMGRVYGALGVASGMLLVIVLL